MLNVIALFDLHMKKMLLETNSQPSLFQIFTCHIRSLSIVRFKCFPLRTLLDTHTYLHDSLRKHVYVRWRQVYTQNCVLKFNHLSRAVSENINITDMSHIRDVCRSICINYLRTNNFSHKVIYVQLSSVYHNVPYATQKKRNMAKIDAELAIEQ